MRVGSTMRYLMAAFSGVLLLAAACGGSSGGSSSGGSSSSGSSGGSSSAGTTVNLSEFKIDPAVINAKAGDTLNVSNTGKVAHDLVVVDSTGKILVKTPLINPNGSSPLALTGVTAGSYNIYCDVTGHKQSGISGTLTVT